MKLAEKLFKMLENNVSTSRYIDVSNSLNALSELVGFIGNKDLSNRLESSADKIHKMAMQHSIDKKQFDQAMKEINLQELFKEVQKEFKTYDDSGKGIRLGRRQVSLKDALINFTQAAQKAKKEE